MENEQTSFVREIDKKGGWIIDHWTKTWDTRAPLAKLDDEIVQAQKDITTAQLKLTALENAKADTLK